HDLPKMWTSPLIEKLRNEYMRCTSCIYLCYIFYSVHAGFTGLLDVIFDQRGNIKSYVNR
ncbi:hypothetical protein KEJ17_06395, partial [Candidatus Bathyarchaeota archaeon]|nr:hypothetical protein [Candidatus Bathyarchaeota archaeon]